MTDAPPASGADGVAVVICHYNPTQNQYLRQLVTLCCAALRRTPDDAVCAQEIELDILVCDGSPERDETLAAQILASGGRYVHGGEQLSFGATYNLGVRSSTAPYVVLMANDVLISAAQVRKLIGEVQKDRIGCAICYLTKGDYYTQISRRLPVPRRCYPASMTLNVNAFRREILEDIGCVPEELSGCFNDMVMFFRLRQKGLRTVLVNLGEVPHLAMVTRKIATNLAWDRDLCTVPKLAPELFSKYKPKSKNSWASLYAACAQNKRSKLLWTLVSYVPWKMKQSQSVAYWAAFVEPYLCSDKSVMQCLISRRK